MKKSIGSLVIIFLSLFCLSLDSNGQVNKSNNGETVINRVSESAKGTKIDSSIIIAALQQDSLYDQPEVHLKLAQSNF